MLGAFRHEGGVLRCQGASVEDLAAAHGTPLYIYSEAAVAEGLSACVRAFEPLAGEVHFAVKACGAIGLLRRLVGWGAGLDVVSGGELERAFLAGCPLDRVMFAGVGKTESELRAALSGAHSPLLGSGLADDGAIRARGPVGLINVESEPELRRADRIARELGVRARAALRVNPDVDARTHAYITTGRKENKFGIDMPRAEALYRRWAAGRAGDEPGVALIGLHAHIGSQVFDVEPYAHTGERLAAAAARLRDSGAAVDLLNLGGGWGVAYDGSPAPSVGDYARALGGALAGEARRGTRITVEPGRSVVARAGVLLARVEYVKRGVGKRFVVLDAGMHTLLRPALYQAFHFAWPARFAGGVDRIAEELDAGALEPADLVGPVCESSDFLALDRPFPDVYEGDLIAVFCAGAYGMSMASTYNDHPRPAEVIVRADGSPELLRRRETVPDLLRIERVAEPGPKPCREPVHAPRPPRG